MEILLQLKSSIVNQPKSFDDCITWAHNQFQEYYYNTIVQLLFNFPADHVSYAKLNTTINKYRAQILIYHCHFQSISACGLQFGRPDLLCTESANDTL